MSSQQVLGLNVSTRWFVIISFIRPDEHHSHNATVMPAPLTMRA